MQKVCSRFVIREKILIVVDKNFFIY